MDIRHTARSSGQLAYFRWLAMGSVLAVAMAASRANAAYEFYNQSPPKFTSEQAQSMARQFNLTERKSETGAPTGIFEMGDGSVRAAFIGGTYHMLPDLTRLGKAPTDTDAKGMARKHVDALGILIGMLPNESWKIVGVNTWTRQQGTQKGDGTRQNVLKSVRFARFIDGVEVMGPNSRVDVDVNGDGVQGMQDTHGIIAVSRLKPILKSPFQIEEEFLMKANMYCGKQYKEMGRKLIYWEQGGKYLTPCWLFDVQFQNPDGTESANMLLVPAVQNPPEVIEDMPEFGGQPPIIPDGQRAAGRQPDPSTGIEQVIEPNVSNNPVQIGEYIVREDHSCWLEDAKAFWANLQFGRNLTPWHQSVNRRDYWWDYPWLWEDALGIPDQSPNYIGKDHYVLIEGHGAPWVITCLRDNAEFIHLNQIKGYGTNQVAGERTCYIQWQSCDVIPVPGDPYAWDFQAPSSAFSVWWTIFKGMRGNYGYHTTMHICNGVSAIHGMRMGLGFPVLSSWLYSTDHGVFGHSSGWDYGSAVIVSGREGDTIYNNNQLPNPSSLTMWWIHP